MSRVLEVSCEACIRPLSYFSLKLETSRILGALKIRNQILNWLIGAFACFSLQIFYLISRDRLTSSFNFRGQFVINMFCFIIN